MPVSVDKGYGLISSRRPSSIWRAQETSLRSPQSDDNRVILRGAHLEGQKTLCPCCVQFVKVRSSVKKQTCREWRVKDSIDL